MGLSYCIIIPARYASTRFPGKPLAEIHGKSMIQRVYEAAASVAQHNRIFIATDDDRIQKHAQGFAQVVMTSIEHPSGTDRCAEAVQLIQEDCDIVINLQGDEPFIKPEQIELLLSLFDNPNVQIATLKKELFDAEDIDNPNIVKVVCDRNNKALYFSRSRIPFRRETPENVQYYKHLGMYAYRKSVLQEITSLAPSMLEETEKLEQLRWLENGYSIAVGETQWQSPAVDTPEDLEKAIQFAIESKD
jgi:3-deoxy-manno-octulosonate cytidylyltransferase (CMP-KDO synthetase)